MGLPEVGEEAHVAFRFGEAQGVFQRNHCACPVPTLPVGQRPQRQRFDLDARAPLRLRGPEQAGKQRQGPVPGWRIPFDDEHPGQRQLRDFALRSRLRVRPRLASHRPTRRRP